MDVLQFALLGLGPGAVYALSALGLVLVYRGSGVLNFAHGALGAVAALWFFLVRDTWGWPTAFALASALALAALSGAAMHLVIMRRLRSATAITRVIATLGVLTAVQGLVLELRGTNLDLVDGMLPDRAIDLLGVTVGRDRLLLAALAIAAALVLAALSRWTRFGIATQAVAENARAAAALGWSPDLVATVTWAVGTAMAALAAILIAPVVGLSMIELSLLVIPALAAALVGRFVSFTATLGGAMAIGIAESELSRFVTFAGASKSVPFLVILAVLALSGHPFPERGDAPGRPARVGSGHIGVLAAVAAVVFVVAVLTLDGDWVAALTTTLIAGIIGISVLVITGYAGQVSLAQYAMAGLGAFVAGRLVDVAGWPFEVAIVAGVAAAVPIGVLVGLPALRTRGLALAVVTLGMALAIERTILLNSDLTGGFTGTVVGDLRLFGVALNSVEHPERYALLTLACAIGVGVLVANLRRGRGGRRLLAMRTNERAAAALGIDVRLAKLFAFALASAIAAVGGILTAFRFPQVIFTEFGLFESIAVVSQTVVGGMGFLAGALGGGTLAANGVASETFPDSAGWVPVMAGVLVVVVLLVAPDGVAGLFARRRRVSPAVEKEAKEAKEAMEGRPHRVRPTRAPAPLVVEDLAVVFGGVRALDGVSLAVAPGAVVGLIGPNGAGKTTLIDAVSGFVRAAGGSVRLGDQRLDGLSPHRRARLGVARSFQSLELFEAMTVGDQLHTAADDWDAAGYAAGLVHPGRTALSEDARWAVDQLGLGDELDVSVGDLPYGRRRLVALARAVASAPAVLLLDEPAAGLDEAESGELGRFIRRLADERGIGVLLVEHDVDLVAAVCDHVVVCDFGRVIGAGPPAEVLASSAVVTAYLGDEALVGAVPT